MADSGGNDMEWVACVYKRKFFSLLLLLVGLHYSILMMVKIIKFNWLSWLNFFAKSKGMSSIITLTRMVYWQRDRKIDIKKLSLIYKIIFICLINYLFYLFKNFCNNFFV